MFKTLTLLLLIGPITEFVGLIQVWVVQVGYHSTLLIFGFHFFYRFSIFPGYHYVGGRGVLKVETNKGSPKDNRPL